MVTANSIQKLRTGEAISDEELGDLISFLFHLVEELELMGPEYGLATKDARQLVEVAEGYASARKPRFYGDRCGTW